MRSSGSPRICERSCRSRRRCRRSSPNGCEHCRKTRGHSSSSSRRSSARRRPCSGRRLTNSDVESLVDEAVAAGAIVVGSDGVVRFTHPLLGAAVYFDMPSGRRRDVHLQAAELVDDVEQQARHLALATSTPDEGIAAIVERAAEAAAERGAPDAAAILSAEAVRLTPPGNEAEHARRTFVGAGYLMEAGDVPEARARIEPLLDPGLPAAVRSQALVFRAETEHQDRPMIRAYLQEAIDIAPDPRVQLAGVDPPRATGWLRSPATQDWPSNLRARLFASPPSSTISRWLRRPPPPWRSTRLPGVIVRSSSVRPSSTARRHCLASSPLADHAGRLGRGHGCCGQGSSHRAREVLRREYDVLARQGRMLMLPLMVMSMLSDLEWRAGRWAEAEAYADDARAILEDALPGGAHVLAFAQVHRRRVARSCRRGPSSSDEPTCSLRSDTKI